MALDFDTFTERHPEFADTDPTLVESVLAQALRRLNLTVWGSKADDGQALLAASILINHPAAECVRLEGQQDTRYWDQFKDMRCMVAMGRNRVI